MQGIAVLSLAQLDFSGCARNFRLVYPFTYWQENACRNPPPPGAVCPLVERVMIVPAATVDPAVAVHEFPAADVVLHEMIEPAVAHTSELVDAVTLYSVHVVLAPLYE